MSIILDSLYFGYGEKPVLQAINLKVEEGSALTLIGPNGAGKTTLLSLIAGLLKPAKGKISFNGKPSNTLTQRQTAQMVGYVPQFMTPTFDYSVLEYIVTGCAPHIGTFEKPSQKHYKIAEEAMELMKIEHLSEKSYLKISGGERQQVSIARAIAQKPQYILMDEPTSHLDFGNQIKVLKTIRLLTQKGFGVVFTTHNPDHAFILNDHTAVLHRKGHLITGKGTSLLTENLLSELYGTDLKLNSLAENERTVCYAAGLE